MATAPAATVTDASASTGKVASASATATSEAGAKFSRAIHSAYRQTSTLAQGIAPDKMRVGFFLGAGCGTAIKVTSGGTSGPLIPDIDRLTTEVVDALNKTDVSAKRIANVLNQLRDSGDGSPNVEQILSRVRSLRQVVANGNVHGLTASDLEELESGICNQILSATNKQLPSQSTPYHRLASWISSIPRTHGVEIFTTNYDLLMEQALEEQRVPYFDGFSGSVRAFFDPATMDRDDLPPSWARLWKLHGSINWRRGEKGRVERGMPGGAADQYMIHPSHLKYDESRQMPYLAMIDRLRAFIGRGQCVMVLSGYSFRDAHINHAIIQGLNANPSAVCFALMYPSLASCSEATACAVRQPNLNVLADDGAVIGTVAGRWSPSPDVDHPLHGSAVVFETEDAASCSCRLGDFQKFGEFLASEISGRRVSPGA